MSCKIQTSRHKGILFFCVLATVFFPSASLSAVMKNTAFTGFHLLEEPISPRLIAMGSAGAAMPSSGFSYYNPAMPFLAAKPYLTLEYGRYSAGDLQRGHFETAWPFEKFFLGISINSASIDDIYPVDERGVVGYDQAGSSQLTSLSLNGGYIAGQRFAVGLCASGIQDRIFNDAAYAISFSAGAALYLIPYKLSLGLAAFHLGTSTGMLDSTLDFGEGARLPVSGRFGAVWRDAVKNVDYTTSMDIVFRNSDRRVMVPVGVEVFPISQLAVRLGKRFNHDTEIFNFGFGLNMSPLSIDVGFTVPKLVDDTELKWLMSITYSLPHSLSKGKKRIIMKEMKVTPLDSAGSAVLPGKPDKKTGGSGIVEDTITRSRTPDTAQSSERIEEINIQKTDTVSITDSISDSGAKQIDADAVEEVSRPEEAKSPVQEEEINSAEDVDTTGAPEALKADVPDAEPPDEPLEIPDSKDDPSAEGNTGTSE